MLLRDLHRIGAAPHQFLGQRKCSLGRAVEAKRTRVGQDRGVQASRDFRRNLHASLARQPENHLGSRACALIDPVHVGKGLRGRVMVNIDQEMFFEPAKPGARHSVTFQDDRRLRVRGLLDVAAARNPHTAAGDRCPERRR